MLSIGIKELLEAGVHFGHQTRRWNPKMKPFIFEARNGIHIIDLGKTLAQLEAACKFLADTVRKGDRVLFVGTKKQAQEAIREAATACGQHYVTERWLGGTLTNYHTIRRSINRLKEIEQLLSSDTINNFGKQEQAKIRREHTRLLRYFEGIRDMDRHPGALFVVDVKRETNAVREGRRLKIPIVAIVDTNCDPEMVDYPIAGNDDAIRSIRLILGVVVQTITAARAEREAAKPSAEAAPAEASATPTQPAEATMPSPAVAPMALEPTVAGPMPQPMPAPAAPPPPA